MLGLIFGIREIAKMKNHPLKVRCVLDENGNLSHGHVEGAVKLVNNAENQPKGILTIFHKGEWGLVCQSHFTKSFGNVVCKQLGFDVFVTNTTVAQVPGGEKFLPRSDMLRMASAIQCKGGENKIAQVEFNIDNLLYI